MRHTLIPLAFGLGASAGVLKRGDGCHSEIHAHGHAHGPVGELSDGQCRVGGGYAPVRYHLNKRTGILTNSKGWGCIIAGEPQQIQCDSGKPGTPTWSVGSDGWISHDGCSDFYACPVTDYDEWNIYKRPVIGQDKCVHITLSSSCHDHESHPPAPPRPTYPPKCCTDCQPEEHECKKTCYNKPDHHHPAPTSHSRPEPSHSSKPKCCDECKHHDHDCKSNCYEKPDHHDQEYDTERSLVSNVEKREVNTPAAIFATSYICDDCPERDHGCKKHCRHDCNSCEKDDHKCKHSCINRCHRCREGEQECKEGCARPYLEPANCKVCRPRDDLCWETCYKDGHKYDDKNAVSKPKWCGDCDDDDLPCKTRCYPSKDGSEYEHPEHEHSGDEHSEDEHLEHEHSGDEHSDDEHPELERPDHSHEEHSKCGGNCSSDDRKCKQSCLEDDDNHNGHHDRNDDESDNNNEESHHDHEDGNENDDEQRPHRGSRYCTECKPREEECHKTCHKQHYHKDQKEHRPKEPKCCDKCKPFEDECHKTCYQKPQEHEHHHHEQSYTTTPCTTSSHHHEEPHYTTPPCTTSSYHEKPHYTSAPSAPTSCHEDHPAPTGHSEPCPWNQVPQMPPSPGQQYGACPANIDGEHQIPHQIVQVDYTNPSKSYGPSYNGKISDSISTLFTFDVPASYSGKTCSLFFLLPKHEELQTSSYKLSGSGLTHWDALWSPPTPDTSYATKADKALHLNDFPLAPGTSYWVADHPCPAGQSVGFEMSGSGVDLEYFQDYNPKPIGLYMRAC